MSSLYNYFAVYVFTPCNKSAFRTGKNRAYIRKTGNVVRLHLPTKGQIFNLLTNNMNTLTKENMKLETDSKGEEFVRIKAARERTDDETGLKRICEFHIYPCTQSVERAPCDLDFKAKDIYNRLLVFSGEADTTHTGGQRKKNTTIKNKSHKLKQHKKSKKSNKYSKKNNANKSKQNKHKTRKTKSRKTKTRK